MKAIISTGQGRLHLIYSAIALKQSGTSVNVITGWIPSAMVSDRMINFLGKFVGRKGNLAAGLRKRTPEELSKDELKACTFSEFYAQFLYKMASYRFLTRAEAEVKGWKLYGNQSKSYIRDAQVFHVRSGAGCAGAIAYARMQGMKVVVDHSIAHPKEMERQLRKAATRDAAVSDPYRLTDPADQFWELVLDDCLQADILLVNSDYVKQSFVEEGFPESKVRVAQLGVNAEFSAYKTDYALHDRLALVFTGGFGSRKGASIIIEALTMLRNEQIPFSFEVVGSILGDVQIPEWMTEDEHVVFHGHLPQDKMLTILLKSDIYIFPSYVEGSAQTVKEAMAVGLPVIATRQSGSPISHGEDGWLIADDDALALAEAIKLLAADQTLRQQMGSKASVTIRSWHTWEQYASDVNEVYRELTK